jgi:hypothetical protein
MHEEMARNYKKSQTGPLSQDLNLGPKKYKAGVILDDVWCIYCKFAQKGQEKNKQTGIC